VKGVGFVKKDIGGSIGMSKEKLLKHVYTAQRANHCQRNWDYAQKIPQDHIDSIVGAAVNMPTKQNTEDYRLFVSTNLEINHEVYKVAAMEDFDFPHRNLQVYAPLLLLYLPVVHLNPKMEIKIKKAGNEAGFKIYSRWGQMTGISSGVAAYVANDLGYSTGFCRCFLPDQPRKYLENKLNIPFNLDFPTKVLALGIGKPLVGYNHNDVVYNDEFVDTLHLFEKKIEIIKYK